jgi:hypothetical protein
LEPGVAGFHLKGVVDMPFTLDDFPLEVNRPQIDVVLPEGTHVLELVVEDSAGLKSAPDQVVITVKREAFPEPRVLSITPRFGLRGKTLGAVIYGENLLNVRAVRFARDSETDPYVQVVLLPGGTASELPIEITIQDDADFGECSWSVTTPGGVAQNPEEASFFVVGKPEISDIDPLWTHQSERWDTVALITGSHLLVPTEPLSAHTVEFLYGPEVDAEVMSRLTAKSTAHQLELEIKAGAGSKLGDHTVRLTTPAGIAHNPPDKFFEVRETPTDAEAS